MRNAGERERSIDEQTRGRPVTLDRTPLFGKQDVHLEWF